MRTSIFLSLQSRLSKYTELMYIEDHKKKIYVNFFREKKLIN